MRASRAQVRRGGERYLQLPQRVPDTHPSHVNPSYGAAYHSQAVASTAPTSNRSRAQTAAAAAAGEAPASPVPAYSSFVAGLIGDTPRAKADPSQQLTPGLSRQPTTSPSSSDSSSGPGSAAARPNMRPPLDQDPNVRSSHSWKQAPQRRQTPVPTLRHVLGGGSPNVPLGVTRRPCHVSSAGIKPRRKAGGVESQGPRCTRSVAGLTVACSGSAGGSSAVGQPLGQDLQGLVGHPMGVERGSLEALKGYASGYIDARCAQPQFRQQQLWQRQLQQLLPPFVWPASPVARQQAAKGAAQDGKVDGRRSSTMFGSALPQHLVRLISTSAAPLVNAAASSGPTALQTLAPILTPKGIASIFGFTPQRTSTPLDEALPAVVTPERSSVPTVRPVLMTSVMPSGTQLATIDSLSPISSLALFVDTGSIYESEETSGATKLLTSLAFKATTNRTTFRLTRELEKLGCSAHATSGRDFAAFSVEFVRMHAPEAAEILIDSVVNAKLNYWEVRENMEAVKDALAEALKNPANVIGEVLHRAAFDGPLGQPLLVDPSQLTLDNDALKAFIAASFQPSRMVLAGVGIDHDEANELSSPLLSYGGARGPPASAAASKYVGGGISVIAPSASTHFALGFEAKGGLSEAKTEALSAVVAALMEEARPTLPRMSRETGVVGSVSSFSHLYKGTGIVGVIGGAAPAQASQLVDAVCKKVEAIAKGVSDAALASAKMVAIGAYTDKLATTPGMLSLMGPHMLFNGKFDAFVFSATVATLTPADVANFVQKGLKSGPTFVTYGNLGSLPRYESIARRFVEKV
ncbi:MAG: hypothetical protein WDW36_002711 [Sanguina aurantia]